MTYDTINDAQTVAGNAEGALLAGRYRVVRQLGQGGMGGVWLAEDTKLDNKPFAVKMLPAILVANKRAYRQLKDEALVAMKLTHPNIVTLRAFEENNGNPFLVMDYIDGQTLDDCLAEKGTLTEEEVIRVLRPVAAALDYAHGEGVVHRDVKPANVMIRKDGHPFVLDFGIAREIQETMTRVTGKLSSGTLLYMSPEQLMGEQPKPAQDIYSFAAMAYECLKGEPPFVRGVIEDQIKNKVPERPAGASVQLARSVMAGLAKKPEERPLSCMAVLSGDDFSRVEHVERVEGRAVSTRPPPVGVRIPRDRSESGGAWKVFTVIALFAALVGGGVRLYHRHQEQQRKQAHIAAVQRAEVVRKAAEEEARRKAEEERKAEEVRKAAEEEARRKAEEERKAEEARKAALEKVRQAAEAVARAAATEMRIEAKVQKANVERISDTDGFKARKDALAVSFARAEAFFDEKTRRWSEAAIQFTNYVNECKALVNLDGERQKAAAKRAEAQAAFRRAEGAGAKTYARTCWNDAVGEWQKADALFKEMEFAEAGDAFASAAKQFAQSEEESVAEQKRRKEKAATKCFAEEKSRRKTKDSMHDKVQLWEGGPYWGETNIGAGKPWELGYYFWWGDTVGYKREGNAWVASDGSSSAFSFVANNVRTFGKDISSLQREGWITTDNALTSEHDAAHVQWGGGWRLPTDKEMKALNNNCNWMWTTTNGVDGYVVSGRGHYASASIFLPYDDKGTDGFGGYYWSSVPCSDRQYSWGLYFNFSAHLTGSYGPRRYDGCPVRPVQGFTK